MKKFQIVIVQPVQSPYWTERLKILAQQDDLDIVLLLEKESFTHRPLWQPEIIEGIHAEVLGSAVIGCSIKNEDLAFRITGLRSLPWKLPAALKQLRPDVVVLCNATQVMSALTVRRMLGFRIALMVEDTPHATRNLGWLTQKLKALAYRRADKLYVFSEDARAFLTSIGTKAAVQYMPWSLDMNSFKRDATAADNRCLALPHKNTVIFIGQFIARKGVLLLLEAWATLPAIIRERVKLILIGDGPLRKEAETICKTHKMSGVVFLGNIPYKKVKTLLKEADLFVLPTLEDLYSLSVLEAMASGCPVIITPFAGSRELVDHGCNGWIVDPTVPHALKSIMEEALSGQVDLYKMGMAARKRVENMDNKIVMDKFAESLKQLAAKNK